MKGPSRGLAFPLRSPVLSPSCPAMRYSSPTCASQPSASFGELCQRRERFDIESLKRQHGGDVKMPELLSRLVAVFETDEQFSLSGALRFSLDNQRTYRHCGAKP
jgi:hypothetical protein